MKKIEVSETEVEKATQLLEQLADDTGGILGDVLSLVADSLYQVVVSSEAFVLRME